MHTRQHTIKEPVTVSGVGLHWSGSKYDIQSASPDHGIKFQRIDLEGQPIVDADVDYVVDLSRGEQYRT